MKVSLLLLIFQLNFNNLFATEAIWKDAYEKRFTLMQDNFSVLVDQCIADRFRSKAYVENSLEKLKQDDFINLIIDDCLSDIEQGIFKPLVVKDGDALEGEISGLKVKKMDEIKKQIERNNKDIEVRSAKVLEAEPKWIIPAPQTSCQTTCEKEGMNSSAAMDYQGVRCKRVNSTDFNNQLSDGLFVSKAEDLISRFFTEEEFYENELKLIKNTPEYSQTQDFLKTNYLCYRGETNAMGIDDAKTALIDVAKNFNMSMWIVKSCYCSYRTFPN